MRKDIKCKTETYLKDNSPTLEEKVDAILEGGQALANLKRKIKKVKARVVSD